MMNKSEIEKKIAEIEKIPLYDVHGGKQRTSKDNEEHVKLKVLLKNL